MWERITYFLKRVVPVAEECKVRICCHPHDPGMPRGKGYRGVERVLGQRRGTQAVRRHHGEHVSRTEFLPGHRGRDAGETRRADLRRDPLVRQPRQDLQRPLPQHQGRLSQLPGNVSRRRRRGHAAHPARLQGGRLRRHDYARPRAAHRGRRGRREGVRLRFRLHSSSHSSD